MRSFFLSFLCLSFFFKANTQVDSLSKAAKNEFFNGNYKHALSIYKKLKRNKKGNANYYNYQIAKCKAKSGKIKIAIRRLKALEKKNYMTYKKIVSDSFFSFLKERETWKKFLHVMELQDAKKSKKYNPKIEADLIQIGTDDQKYRQLLLNLQMNKEEKLDSILIVSQLIQKIDSLNLIRVKDIYNKCGKWPGQDQVGEKGNQFFFLIIQHADLNTQKQFLSALKKSVKKNLTPKYYYPYLIDRILVGEKKEQIFGTQVIFDEKTNQYVPTPIKNIKRVSKLRSKFQLPNLESYINALNKKNE